MRKIKSTHGNWQKNFCCACTFAIRRILYKMFYFTLVRHNLTFFFFEISSPTLNICFVATTRQVQENTQVGLCGPEYGGKSQIFICFNEILFRKLKYITQLISLNFSKLHNLYISIQEKVFTCFKVCRSLVHIFGVPCHDLNIFVLVCQVFFTYVHQNFSHAFSLENDADKDVDFVCDTSTLCITIFSVRHSCQIIPHMILTLVVKSCSYLPV